MDERLALIGLNYLGGLGSVRLKRLLESFGSAAAVMGAPFAELHAVWGIGDKLAGRIVSFDQRIAEQEIQRCRRLDIRIITFWDAEYPALLRTIYDPPIVLYVKGSLKGLEQPCLAVVGSRRATLYGLQSARRFSCELARHGVTIVSGLARGIDTQSHRGALVGAGSTIAIVGNGLAQVYPPENRRLAEEIVAQGALISEFPLDAEPRREHFPQRNRLISGVSNAVFVVEAARNSGALITVDCALEQGRDVLALPGACDSAQAFGPNNLIKQGAKLVMEVADILEELPGCAAGPAPQEQPAGGRIAVDIGAVPSDEESRIVTLLSDGPLGVDQIVEKAALSVARVAAILVHLQVKRLVRQLPGNRFIDARSETACQ